MHQPFLSAPAALYDMFSCFPCILQVNVNGTDYQPTIASPNKKHAKAQAATVALQSFGLVPKTDPI